MPPDLPPRLADELRDVGEALLVLRQSIGPAELLSLRDNPPLGHDLTDQLRGRPCPHTDFAEVRCACPDTPHGYYTDPCTIGLICPGCGQRRRAAPSTTAAHPPPPADGVRAPGQQRIPVAPPTPTGALPGWRGND